MNKVYRVLLIIVGFVLVIGEPDMCFVAPMTFFIALFAKLGTKRLKLRIAMFIALSFISFAMYLPHSIESLGNDLKFFVYSLITLSALFFVIGKLDETVMKFVKNIGRKDKS